MLKKSFLFIFLLSSTLLSISQNVKGILFNQADSSALTFATIQLSGTDQYTLADEKGAFKINLPGKSTEIRLKISHVTCHTSVAIRPNENEINRIYLDCSGLALKDVLIEGFSARRVVERAIRKIPQNYTDSTYASPSFFRQYQKVNGKFSNLIETQGMTSFQITKSRRQLSAIEAIAIGPIRRSNFYPVEDFEQDNFARLMQKNPLLHIENSIIDPRVLGFYQFYFDTTETQDYYVINYTCTKFTSEDHGISNYSEAGFEGEGWETGKLTIDKESFAFIRIERNAFRNPGYAYRNNNYIIPKREFTIEFADGKLVIDYEKIKGKWYLKSLLHNFTNYYYRTRVYRRDYTLTECFEWHATNVPTRYIPQQYKHTFFANPDMTILNYVYDPGEWQKYLPGFYFFPKDSVYSDLGKEGAIEQQFIENGGG